MAIHASDTQLVAHVAGGGMTALSELLAVPGASRTVLNATVPYATTALRALLGETPDGACSASTAAALAEHALASASNLTEETDIIGVGCTAALTTIRQRRGSDRAFISVATAQGPLSTRVDLDDVGRDRAAQERIVADALLRAIAAACGVDPDDHSAGGNAIA